MIVIIPSMMFCAIFCCFSAVDAAEIQDFSLEHEGLQRIIHFDLTGKEHKVNVVMAVTVKGKRYRGKDLHLSGDIGLVKPGRNKVIIWNVPQDFPEGTRGQVDIKLTTEWVVFKDRETDMEFVTMKGGCFKRGDIFGDGSPHEQPVHDVCLNDFLIGKHEVKVSEFKQFAEDTGYRTEVEKGKGKGCHAWNGRKWERENSKNWKNPGFEQNGDHPAVCISWNDALKFTAWLSRKSGRNYRLPTEAEWEYAARSRGNEVKYAWDSDGPDGNIADECARGQCPVLVTWLGYDDGYVFTAPVGKFTPNGSGLHDMTGNVSEWCQDWYDKHYYQNSTRKDPQGPAEGTYRAVRGGSWSSDPERLRISNRAGCEPGKGYANLGFRLVTADE